MTTCTLRRVCLTLTAAAVLCTSAGRLAAQTPPPAPTQPQNPPTHEDFERLQKKLEELTKKFQAKQQELEEHRKQEVEHSKKLDAVAKKHLDAEAATAGSIENARRTLSSSLPELNAKLNRTPAAQVNASAAGPKIEPGMQVEVLLRDQNYFSGTLVGVRDRKVLLQTIPLPGARPSEFDINNIAAFSTHEGMFAINPRTGQFERSLTYYSFNRATGNFIRMDENYGDPFLAQNARVVGGTNSSQALFSIGASGSWALGLPIPTSTAPKEIPAYNFQQIITERGTYTWDDNLKDYTYKSHEQFAAEARAARDKAGQEWYDREWARRVQEYELTTERVKAMRPVFAGGWWGGHW